MLWHCKDKSVDLARTRVMGIVNITPDSFSDGGAYYRAGEAVARARNCIAEGADIIDIGGESTRPDAVPIGWQVEWNRIGDALRILMREFPDAVVSVDTYHPETAERAVEMGVAAINCVHPESAAAMCRIAKRTGCGLVLPCRSRADFELLPLDGIAPDSVLIDPMIGFGTTREEDFALLGALRRLAELAPVCVGVSRKRLVKKLTGENPTGKNLGGSIGVAIWCAMNGASVVRVHDVKETVSAIGAASALANAFSDVNPKGATT